MRPRRGPNDLQHPFGRVLLLPAEHRTPLFKVCRHGVHVAKVDGAAAAGEEQQAVELLEERGRGLVDGAEDGLAVVREAADEGGDGPGGLGVEPGGGLVEEEEEVGFAGELDSDGEAFALFDVEAWGC